jgi:hypothetical protein
MTLAAACSPAPPIHAAKWQVNLVSHMVMTPPGGVIVDQMSGVTYLGLVGGSHRFIAAEEVRGELVGFDVAFNASGSITGISNIAAIPINPPEDLEDFEGIAFTNPARNSVFLCDEDALGAGDHLGVREVSLATGTELQAVNIPAVFSARRANLGFESLARSPDGTVMWTANEQALTVDGPISTSSFGTNVRLLKLNVAGDAVAAGPQFAYQVEPIHGTSPVRSPQSGLSDLVALPDGTLIALERSVSLLASPSTYLNRIYEIDFNGATDISAGLTADGLAGQTFTPVAKDLLWSGPVDGTNGQNLEGLTLGPRLANGDWLLIGVVDDEAADLLSMNTVVAFTLSPILSADFDDDGDVDGGDYLSWQRGLGTTIGATQTEGDADRDGDVDATDLTHWSFAFAAPAVSVGETTSAVVPEPTSAVLTLCGLLASKNCRRRRCR